MIVRRKVGDGVIAIEECVISWLIDNENSKEPKKPVTKQKKPERKEAPSAEQAFLTTRIYPV